MRFLMTDRPARIPRRCARVLALALVLFPCLMLESHAQMGGGGTGAPSMSGGGRGGRHGNQQQNTQRTPAIPDLPPVKEPWPRLDTGAVLCKSRDDLVKLQARTAPGGDTTGPAPDCHIIHQRTPIQILDRDGPSRTHVVSTDAAKQTGWTNTYLTSSPPPSAVVNSGFTRPARTNPSPANLPAATPPAAAPAATAPPPPKGPGQ